MIALLGQRDAPTDAIEDFCIWLEREFKLHGQSLEILRMPWPERGWVKGLIWLLREARTWRGQWILVQYTALGWSRRGIPFGILAVLCVLRLRKAKAAIVFHDAAAYGGLRKVDRVRMNLQTWIMRRIYFWSQRSILTVPVDKVSWLPSPHEKATFIPVGASFSGKYAAVPETRSSRASHKTVAVFSVTGGAHVQPESEFIARVVCRASEGLTNVRLLVLGRHGDEAAIPLRAALVGSNVELEAYGVLPTDEIERRLSEADVLLFVRGGISSRRSSAMAGIICGLAVVGYSGSETGPPVTDAGVMLAPEGNINALSEALGRVLKDDALRTDLRRRSLGARDKYFSWDTIGRSYLRELNIV